MVKTRLVTSESVGAGHPDKVADQISDAILDAILAQDPLGRVACETLVTTGLVVIAGELTYQGSVDFAKVARKTLNEIGYTDARFGIDGNSCGVITSVHEQSQDIALGVDQAGAGDQGMMYGFACRETPELMPMPIMLAHQLVKRQSEVRRSGVIPWLRPDAKSQVTIEYDEAQKPVRIRTVVLSTQHEPLYGSEEKIGAEDRKREHEEITRAVSEHIIRPMLPAEMVDDRLIIHVNPTGRFVRGGPHGDTGLTGRKIIVDTYGGVGRHGGGAFSGKDPSKVDRSASYAVRHIAKNVVAAGLAERVEIQVAYAIGKEEPVSIHVDDYGTGKLPHEKIERAIRELFDMRPAAIIERLQLRRPIYRKTAAYGHFGRDEKDFTWEATDYVEALQQAL